MTYEHINLDETGIVLDALKICSYDLIKHYNIIPIDLTENNLDVIESPSVKRILISKKLKPLKIALRDDLKESELEKTIIEISHVLKRGIKPVLATKREIKNKIKGFKSYLKIK